MNAAGSYLAAGQTAGIGPAHSIPGERYRLPRLCRRDNLPRLFGGTQFTTRTRPASSPDLADVTQR